ncbi:MAG: hypothetical protein ACRDHK_09430 [Actinomycetota bacterium]
MPRFEVFPDAEAVASVALRAASITDLEVRVYSSIPKDPTYPLAIVQRLGGNPAERHHLDGPRIQVEVYAESKSQAHDVAALARVALFELEGTAVSDPDAYVTGVEDAVALQWLPDPATDKDRYVFSVYLYLHA